MKFFLIFLVLFSTFALSKPVVAQQGARFLSVIPEMPLMPSLIEDLDAAVVFDGPSGRIVEAVANGDVSSDAVNAFYAASLPQLGWTSSSEGIYRRDAEILKIEIFPAETGYTGTSVEFILRPIIVK